MHKVYIFDVDGTLTPSRQRMNKQFAVWFSKFCESNNVYLVTGSDKAKTVEQVGEYIYFCCKKVYQCSGNDVWIKSNNVKTNTILVSDKLQEIFDYYLKSSSFKYKTGNHVEIRPGLINYSIVGRDCTLGERESYVTWDKHTSERQEISEAINKADLGYIATVAGETGLDVTLVGNGKEQIIHDFSPHNDLHFFGDKMLPGGNDYTLALEVIRSGGACHHVKDWKDTWNILKINE